MSDFSPTTGHSILPLSNLPAIANRVKHMTMGLGVFLLIFALSMPIWVGTYALSILLASIFFLMGIFGVVAGSKIKARPTLTPPIGQSVLIEVKCKSCNTLNPETSQFCASCGARL